MKIVFFGTPLFAAKALKYLLDHDVSISLVITKPDKAKGRSGTPVFTPVKEIALNHVQKIPVFQPEMVSAIEFAPILEAYQADLFVVVAYGEIIKQHLLDMPKLGCINLHASLLPKYRGAAPIQRCIIEGEAESGVTVMHMVRKMDAGDMIKTVKVPIDPEMTAGELENRLCDVGCQALLDVIKDFKKGIINRVPQDPLLATLAPKLELEDCEIDWNRPATIIHNLVRGVNPFPGAWCRVLVKGVSLRLKVLATEVVEGEGVPASILSYGRQGIVVASGKGALHLHIVQLEGKKAIASEEFARGYVQEDVQFVNSLFKVDLK